MTMQCFVSGDNCFLTGPFARMCADRKELKLSSKIIRYSEGHFFVFPQRPVQPTPHAGLGFPGTLQGDNERQQHQEETANEAPVLLGCRCCPSQSALMG